MTRGHVLGESPASFQIPISIGESTEGLLRVSIYVDELKHISYDDENDLEGIDFDSLVCAIRYPTPCVVSPPGKAALTAKITAVN
jgi:hypothetical protein